tara:strand:+ start:287 stop:1867 length:1581 start_codon:yes stop_codon:yes gene_type:complete
MAAPIFNTIDFSKQIADNNRKTNSANLAGLQAFSNNYLAGRQQNINQARQLLSDFDAIMNEVDDSQKENMSEEIADVQKSLASNIYKRKGINGVNLKLGDLNSNDFNYARKMRELKNLAVNSKLLKEKVDKIEAFAKTDQYILTTKDKVNMFAELATFSSGSKALKQTPKEFDNQLSDIYENYRDGISEAVDLTLARVSPSTTSRTFLDTSNNLIEESSQFYDKIASLDNGEVIIDEQAIDEFAKAALKNKIIMTPNVEDFKEGLRQRAINSVSTKQSIRTDSYSLDYKKALTERATMSNKATKNALNTPFSPDNIAKTAVLISNGGPVAESLLSEIQYAGEVNKAVIIKDRQAHFEYMRERDTGQTIISRDDGQEINLYPEVPDTKVAFMMPVEGEDMRKQVFKPVNELDPKELEYFLSLKSTEFRVGDSKDKINDQDTLLDNYLSEIARAKLHYDKMWFENNKGKGPVILSDPKDGNSFPNYVPANDPKKIESYLRQLDKNSQGAINNAQINYQTDPNDPLSIN